MRRALSITLLALLVLAAVILVADALGVSDRWEAQRAAARAEELQAQAQLLTLLPLVIASAQDSVLAFAYSIVNQVLVIVLAVALWKQRGSAPLRPATKEGDVTVPLLQAIVSGLFAGLGTLTATATAASSLGWDWSLVSLATATATVGVAWARWSGLLNDTRALLRKVEQYERIDDTPAQPEPARSLRVEFVSEADNRIQYTRLDADAERVIIAAMARRVVLSRRGVATLRGIGDDRARAILSDLEDVGLIAYPGARNAPEGARLTSKGRALARQLTS